MVLNIFQPYMLRKLKEGSFFRDEVQRKRQRSWCEDCLRKRSRIQYTHILRRSKVACKRSNSKLGPKHRAGEPNQKAETDKENEF